MAQSSWKIVKIKATARTPYAITRPSRSLDSSARIRSIAALWPTEAGGFCTATWDLDLMLPEMAAELARATLSGVFVGHDAGPDLFWLKHLAAQDNADIWPDLVLDTWLLSRLKKPDAWKLFRQHLAGLPDDRLSDELVMMLKAGQKDGRQRHALSVLQVLRGERLVAENMAPSLSWCEPSLSDLNHSELVRWLDQTASAAEDLISAPLDAWQGGIKRLTDKSDPFYGDKIEPMIRYALEMSARGVPWDIPAARKYRVQKKEEARGRVDLALADPVFKPLLQSRIALENPSYGMTDSLIAKWVEVFALETSDLLPRTESGGLALSLDALRLSGMHNKAPKTFSFFEQTQQQKQLASDAARLTAFAEKAVVDVDLKGFLPMDDDRSTTRIHPFLGFSPETDRLFLMEPNGQGIHSDPEFRKMLRAVPGHKLVSFDFKQIELRIAAGLALRAQEQILASLTEPKLPARHPLAERAVALAKEALSDSLVVLKTKSEAWAIAMHDLDFVLEDQLNIIREKESGVFSRKKFDTDLYRRTRNERDLARFGFFLSTVLLRNNGRIGDFSPMAEAFRSGLDPHLLTGVHMSLRQDNAGSEGESALSVLKQWQEDGVLQEKQVLYEKHRSRAKPVNFGLIYGMTPNSLYSHGVVDYNLDWTPADALSDFSDWFDLYPDVGLWQAWTIVTPEWEGDLLEWSVTANQSKRRHEKSWRVTSLDGRVYVRETFRQALNYQDQGTGAHILADAVKCLDPECRSLLVNQIHDELLAEIPTEDVESVQGLIASTMRRAGENILAAYKIPVEVSVSSSEYWLA